MPTPKLLKEVKISVLYPRDTSLLHQQSIGEKMELSECSLTTGDIRPPVFLNGERSPQAHICTEELYEGAMISLHTERNLFITACRKTHIFHKTMKYHISGCGGVV